MKIKTRYIFVILPALAFAVSMLIGQYEAKPTQPDDITMESQLYPNWEKVFWHENDPPIDSVTHTTEQGIYEIQHKNQLRFSWVPEWPGFISHQGIDFKFSITIPLNHSLSIETSEKKTSPEDNTQITFFGFKTILNEYSTTECSVTYRPVDEYVYCCFTGVLKVEKWAMQRKRNKDQANSQWSPWEDIKFCDYIYIRRDLFVTKRKMQPGTGIPS